MPFVQGHLRREPVTVTFETECVHCQRPLRLDIDRNLDCRVSEGAAPLAFLPVVDFAKWKDPSIIDGF